MSDSPRPLRQTIQRPWGLTGPIVALASAKGGTCRDCKQEVPPYDPIVLTAQQIAVGEEVEGDMTLDVSGAHWVCTPCGARR